MRILLLSALLASAAVASMAADNASLNGKWMIHNNVMGNESDMSCTFTQKDNDLSGTCTSDTGEGKVTGKITGAKITWSYVSEYNGSPLTTTYIGTQDSATGKITGTMTVEQFGVDGDFTAVKAK
jgi:hypothetical protein